MVIFPYSRARWHLAQQLAKLPYHKMDKLSLISKGLNLRFPAGNTPYQIMTRLLEECGELAQQVNHFEASGIKRQKHGEPDKAKLAKEVMDVLRAAYQIAFYYDIEQELQTTIEQSYVQMVREGLIGSEQ
jgi:NTP pyrophosphatase (non-canonical NTP hydrolase)